METVANTSDLPNANSSTFYRMVWRWHFFAGLFVIPFMVMLSVTGIIYLFKPQLDAAMYRDLIFVTPAASARGADEQLAAVMHQMPAAAIKSFTPSPAADRSSIFDVNDGPAHWFVFVDPYTARVFGKYDADRNLQNYALLLHGELMIGRVGDTLVELAACWALVLMITGLYLWFPRSGSGIRGTLIPRILNKSKRILWRDIHSTVGFYGSLIVIFMILTGLFWTGFWGETFAGVWSGFPPAKNAGSVASAVPTGSLNTTSDKKVAWAVEPMPMPESHPASAHQEHHADMPHDSGAQTPAADIPLSAVTAIAERESVVSGYSIIFPQGEKGVYTISAPLGDPYSQRTIHVDRYSGETLANVGWNDYAAVPKAVTAGISLHEGLVFGIWNQLLMLFAALTVLILAVSGTIMWWQRRPTGKLGIPPMPTNAPLWKTAVAIICILGIIFPLVGTSLIIVMLLDRFVLRKLLQRSQATSH